MHNTIQECRVSQQLLSPTTDLSRRAVHGVVCLEDGKPRLIEADLVADAGGRGSHAPRWLTEVGFALTKRPSSAWILPIRVRSFASHITLSRNESFSFGPGPNHPKMGFLAENEGEVWMLSLGGRFGDYPPVDADGFLAFAKSLHTSKLHEMVKNAERVSDFSHFRFPTSLWRHYEKLEKVPEGLIVLGDAVASFNPVYAQGMTSAALQAEALQLLFGTNGARMPPNCEVYRRRSSQRPPKSYPHRGHWQPEPLRFSSDQRGKASGDQ